MRVANIASKARLVASFILMVVICSGCNRRAVEPIPVRGRVTFNGGDWQKPGRLYFTSQPNPDMPTRPGFASFGIDGQFKVTTIHPDDGLLPGEYRVHVECWEVPPSMGKPGGKSCVPPKFQNAATSGLELVVKPDETSHEANFDVR